LCLQCDLSLLDLHSFPTRRSSDLFDPAHMTVSELQGARKASGRPRKWVPVTGSVETLRMRKDARELTAMRRAAVLAGEIMDFARSEEHTSELQSRSDLVCRLLLEK